jgi:hypothetical protein
MNEEIIHYLIDKKIICSVTAYGRGLGQQFRDKAYFIGANFVRAVIVSS